MSKTQIICSTIMLAFALVIMWYTFGILHAPFFATHHMLVLTHWKVYLPLYIGMFGPLVYLAFFDDPRIK
jgi:TRAP-type C4-dicarboxylate transport system permease small subunit